MDFEEQLEKAEKLSTPSLVGSSLRSADDSQHKNYIHPEKYKRTIDYSKDSVKDGISNKYIQTSLDELINEGALLGSEENFETYLDDKGVVKDDAKFVSSSPDDADEVSKYTESTSREPVETTSTSAEHDVATQEIDADSSISKQESASTDPVDHSSAQAMYQQSDYSTPNLSQYQLDNDIKDHSDFISSVKSYDPQRLPHSSDYKVNKVPSSETTKGEKGDYQKVEPSSSSAPAESRNTAFASEDGIHTPYFHLDSQNQRSFSKTRFNQRTPTPGVSGSKPHLARGDSYKNTIPSNAKYELPPGVVHVDNESQDESPRRSRQSKPTMGESIAAAEREDFEIDMTREPSLVTSGDYTNFDVDAPRRSREAKPTMRESVAAAEGSIFEGNMSREPSLVTTGDYTNFDVDRPSRERNADYNLSSRSASSTNYLRTISRSRSRARHSETEKNDASPDALVQEGALVTDDPYATIGGLDTMVEEVLHVQDSNKNEASHRHAAKDAIMPDVYEEHHDKENATVEEKNLNELEKHPEKSVGLQEGKAETEDSDQNSEKGAENENVLEKSVDMEEAKEKTEESDQNSEEGAENENVPEKSVDMEDAKEETEENGTPSATAPLEEEKPLVNTESGSTSGDLRLTNGAKEVTEGGLENAEDTDEKVEADEAIPKESPVNNKEVTKSDESIDDLQDIDVDPEELTAYLKSQPIYIFTSLAGGFQIISRTNRLATILQANEIKFTYRDLGTDANAKKIWLRQAKGKTMPGVVRGDDLVGNWQEIEDANEEYRVHELIYETL